MGRKGLLSTVIPGLNKTGEEKHSTLSIDYPQVGEKVACGHYAIRISGSEGECQAAIDGGEWQSCRSADGYSWYDWCPTETGEHRISVRTRIGSRGVNAERTCRVV